MFFVPMAVISAATRRVGCSTPAVAFCGCRLAECALAPKLSRAAEEWRLGS